jgi:hypothetical protein
MNHTRCIRYRACKSVKKAEKRACGSIHELSGAIFAAGSPKGPEAFIKTLVLGPHENWNASAALCTAPALLAIDGGKTHELRTVECGVCVCVAIYSSLRWVDIYSSLFDHRHSPKQASLFFLRRRRCLAIISRSPKILGND